MPATHNLRSGVSVTHRKDDQSRLQSISDERITQRTLAFKQANTRITQTDSLLSKDSITGGISFSPSESSASLISNAYRYTTRRKDPSYTPRPRNSFFVFRSWYIHSQFAVASGEGLQKNLSRKAAEVWGRMSDHDKQKFRDQAVEEKKKHKEMYPQYVYSPKRRKQLSQPVTAWKKARTPVYRSSSSPDTASVVASSGPESPPFLLPSRAFSKIQGADQQAAPGTVVNSLVPSSGSSACASEEAPSAILISADGWPITASPVLSCAAQDEEEESVQVLDLVEEHKELDFEITFPGDAPPFYPHLDADTIFQQPLRSESGDYGQEPDLEAMYEVCPIFPQTGCVGDLMHRALSSASDLLEDGDGSCAPISNAFGEVDFRTAECDPVDRSASMFDMKYEVAMDYEEANAEAERMEIEYIDFDFFDLPL